MLCNYMPLQTTARWQVARSLRRPAAVASITTGPGRVVRIPPARAGEIVIAKVRGCSWGPGRGPDLPAPFALSPQASTLQLIGADGDLHMDVFRIAVSAGAGARRR